MANSIIRKQVLGFKFNKGSFKRFLSAYPRVVSYLNNKYPNQDPVEACRSMHAEVVEDFKQNRDAYNTLGDRFGILLGDTKPGKFKVSGNKFDEFFDDDMWRYKFTFLGKNSYFYLSTIFSIAMLNRSDMDGMLKPAVVVFGIVPAAIAVTIAIPDLLKSYKNSHSTIAESFTKAVLVKKANDAVINDLQEQGQAQIGAAVRGIRQGIRNIFQ